MEKCIENLVKGSFEYENARLIVSEKRIESSIGPGGETAGVIRASASDGRELNLAVFTSDPRITAAIDSHPSVEMGEGEVSVAYRISSRGLDCGFVFKGEIVLVSDAGECVVPVVLNVVREYMNSSVGQIKNLFHFTNLARTDFDEAVRVFYSPDFKTIFEKSDQDKLFCYRAFSAVPGMAENVEEFLISVHKKSPVVYSFLEENIRLSEIHEDIRDMLHVQKSGWGYTHVRITSDSDFLELARTEFSSFDFLGNKLDVEYRIHAEKLHAGLNLGAVRLSSPHSEVVMPVFVSNRSGAPRDREIQKKAKQLTLDLTECYLRFRIRDITSAAWIRESEQIVEKMLHISKHDLTVRLYQVHLLLSARRMREAGVLLNALEEEYNIASAPPELRGYYMYLKAGQSEKEETVEEAVEKVWSLYESHRNIDRLLWILIYLDESVKRSPIRERELLEKQYEIGSVSPLLYIEAYSIFSNDPELLHKLTGFEIHVLYFAVRRGLMKRSLSEQVILLSSRVRYYDELLFQILKAYFEEFRDNDSLSAICSYLIRTEQRDRRYFGLFEEAVLRELRITNLYEYFLYTLPENHVTILPRNVLMYFSMDSELKPSLLAYVYANMIVHEEETAQVLEHARDHMAAFALKELREGHVDENLAVVYDYLGYLKGGEFGTTGREEIDRALASVAFMRMIRCRDPRMKYVIVIERQLKDEKKYPLKDGRANVRICGGEYGIFFEDALGHRYEQFESGYDEIPLLHTATVVRQIDARGQEDIGLCIYLCERGRNYVSVDGKNAFFVRKAVFSAQISEEFRKDLRSRLLEYYLEEEKSTELDSFLDAIDTSVLSMEERNEILRYMILRDMIQKGYDMVKAYGASGLNARTLVRLLTLVLNGTERAPEEEKDPDLLGMAYYAFHEGKYNDVILSYLMRHYEGTVRTLRRIWKAAEAFELDVSGIEEKILEQMLKTRAFVGEKDDIFFDYVKRGATPMLEYAYLSNSAYDYFVKEQLIDGRVFPYLMELHEDGMELNDVCMLSLIHYYADMSRNERQTAILTGFIRRMLARDVIFSFFWNYRDALDQMDLYEDLSFVEYRTNPRNRVVLYYIISDDTDDRADYIREDLTNIYGGIFSRKFVLFEGEVLQYYIMEEAGGTENLTHSGVLVSETRHGGDSRYALVNDMIVSRSMQDDGSTLDLMEQYIRRQNISELF